MISVIFDLDGTLIDSVPDIHAAIARTLADEGAPPLPIPMVRGFIGNGVPVLIDRVMAARGEPDNSDRRADLIARFMRHYAAASSDLTTVYPGVTAALEALHSAGHPIGLCTNKPEAAARDILIALGLARFFQTIVGGDSLAECKPHPAPLLAAQRILGGGAAVYVGDSEVDVQTACAANLPLLLYTQGYRATALDELAFHSAFDDFSALPGLIKAFGR